MVVGAHTDIGDDAAHGFEIGLKVGTGAPGTVGSVEFKNLCLGVEDITLRNAAHESIVSVLHFSTEAQDPDGTEDAFPVCANFSGPVAGSQV